MKDMWDRCNKVNHLIRDYEFFVKTSHNQCLIDGARFFVKHFRKENQSS